MYLFTLLKRLTVFCMVTDSCSHLSIQALQTIPSYVRLGSFVFCTLRLSSKDPSNLRNRSSSVCWLGQRFLSCCVFGNCRASLTDTLDLLMYHGVVLVWLVRQFEVVRVIEWHGNLSELSIENSLLVKLSLCQAFCHICRLLFLICFFRYNNYIAHWLRCLCFLFGCLRFLPMRLVLLHAKSLPSAVLGRVEFLFAILLKVLLSRTFPIPLWCCWSCWGTRPELCQSTKHSSSLSGRIPASSEPLPSLITSNRSLWFSAWM